MLRPGGAVLRADGTMLRASGCGEATKKSDDNDAAAGGTVGIERSSSRLTIEIKPFLSKSIVKKAFFLGIVLL